MVGGKASPNCLPVLLVLKRHRRIERCRPRGQHLLASCPMDGEVLDERFGVFVSALQPAHHGFAGGGGTDFHEYGGTNLAVASVEGWLTSRSANGGTALG